MTLGAEPVWYSDIDPPAQKVFEHHWPGVPNLGDVRLIDWDSVPRVDVLTAGYPCQPFSVAGMRRGVADERHLWPFIAAGIRTLRPGIIFLENVPGHRARGFGDVLGDLAALGYRVAWGSVRASDIGAAHRRERVFVVAADSDSAGLERFQSAWRLDVSTGSAVADSASIGRIQRQSEPTRERRRPDAAHSGDPVVSDTDRGGRDGRAHIPKRRAKERTSVAGSAESVVEWGDYSGAVHRWESVLGRPVPYPLAFGPRGGKKVSPRFAEWLMGLDEGHISGVPGFTLNEALKLAGNGVLPHQAAYALRLLLPLLADDRRED